MFQRAGDGYAGVVRHRLTRVAAAVLLVYGGLVGLTRSRSPRCRRASSRQDMGYLIVVVQLPDASSFERTDATVRRVDEIARKIPGIAHTFAISGYSSVLQAKPVQRRRGVPRARPIRESQRPKSAR